MPAAVAAANKQMSEMALSSRNDEDDLEKSLEEDRAAIAAKVEEILEADVESLDQTVAALSALREEMGVSGEDLLGFVFEAVFDEDILKDKEVEQGARLFNRLQQLCSKPKTAQQVMLVCIETLCGDRCESSLLKRTPHVLKAFYDTDLVEEEAILKWHEKKAKVRGEHPREARAALSVDALLTPVRGL